MARYSFSIVAVGDICLGDHYFSLGHGAATNFLKRKAILVDKAIEHTIKSADVAFCNIECPLSRISDGRSKVEQAVFRGCPGFARLISTAGFTVANIANNHICQHGAQAFDATVTALQGQAVEPIGFVGSGKYSSVPYKTIINGLSLGFIGYSLIPERYMPRQTKYAMPNEQQVLHDTRELAGEVDIVVVSLHAGEEGVILPHPHIVSFFREIVEVGATIVLGHHPHVFQPVERWKKGLIVYSLGDFIFDLFWNHLLLESAVVQIDISPDKEIDFKIVPVALQADYTVRLLHGTEKNDFFARVEKSSSQISELDDTAYKKIFMQHVTASETGQVLSKGGYFVRNFMKGSILLKSQFICQKLKKLGFSLMAGRRTK